MPIQTSGTSGHRNGPIGGLEVLEVCPYLLVGNKAERKILPRLIPALRVSTNRYNLQTSVLPLGRTPAAFAWASAPRLLRRQQQTHHRLVQRPTRTRSAFGQTTPILAILTTRVSAPSASFIASHRRATMDDRPSPLAAVRSSRPPKFTRSSTGWSSCSNPWKSGTSNKTTHLCQLSGHRTSTD